MRIQVIARSSTKATDGTPLRWKVDIHIDGTLHSEDLDVEDPLDKKGRALCRWYLNKYRQKEPYSTTKAKSAETLLRSYGARLEEQLRLAKHIDTGEPCGIEIVDDFVATADSQSSVQQLHWEFLEDGGLWPPAASVFVHRLTPPKHPAAPRQEAAESRLPRKKLRILLVNARDLRRESVKGSEINPSAVSDILWNIKSKLHHVGSKTELRIEIVRPGTFDALKRHLDRGASRSHTFDIVHFDMHGSVSTHKDGTATGHLHFSDPESLETLRMPAKEVLALFRGRSIPAIVFNACDSANATAGDGGNIARAFAQDGGSQNVLAMTHKASESAVAKFLLSFYTEVLVRGRDFVQAAKAARFLLRSEPLRDARFHLHVPVIDWTVPVVYSSRSGLVPLCLPSDPSGTLPKLPVKLEANREGRVIGRDFDLLRLEKTLLPGGFVYLQGEPGVGKSALLHQLSTSWTQSDFVAHVYHVELSSEHMLSTLDFLKELWRQRRACGSQPCYSHLDMDSSLNGLNELRICLSIHRTALILDGLEDDGSSRPHLASQILQLWSSLSSTNTNEKQAVNTFVVISGRSKSAIDRLNTRKDIPVYELKGLQNADAISLVRRLYPPQTTPSHDKAGPDLSYAWSAEPVIHLLQGNPAALTSFVQMARECDMTLPQLYHTLHSEDIVQILTLEWAFKSFDLLSEFMSCLEELSDESYAIWVMLAWYWHIGPVEEDFADMLAEVDIITDKALVSKSVDDAQRLGYIARANDGNLSWISPLFTIFMRIASRSSNCRFRHFSLDVWQDYRRTFASNAMDHLVPNGSFTWLLSSGPCRGPGYAIRLMTTMLSTHWTRDQDHKYWTFLIYFFSDTDKRSGKIFREATLNGLVHGEIMAACNSMQENFFFVTKLCRGRGPIALPHNCWPTEMLFDIGYFVFQAYNMEQTSMVAGYLEQLLDGAILQCRFTARGNAIRLNDLPVVLQLASTLAEVHRRHISSRKSRKMEFIKIATDILESSEAKFGISSEPKVKMAKSTLYLTTSTMHMDDRNPEESMAKLQEALSGIREATELSNPEVSSRLQEFLHGLRDTEAASYKNFFESYADTGKKMENVWNMALAESIGYDVKDISVPRGSGVKVASHPLNEMWDMLLQNSRQMSGSEYRSNRLESEMDRGHWMRGLGHHGAMVLQNLKKLDFDQMKEHFDAQEEIVDLHGEEAQRDRLGAAREYMDMLQEWIAIDPSSITLEQLKKLDKFAATLDRFGVDTSSMRKMNSIVLEASTRDADENLPHNHAPGVLAGNGDPKARMMSFLQSHASRAAASMEYGQKIVGALAGTLETLRSLEFAEDESAVDDIYKHLGELERLGEDELCHQFIDASSLSARRHWNTTRLMRDVMSEIESIQQNGDTEKLVEDFGRLFDRSRAIIALDGRADQFQEVLELINDMGPSMHLITWTQRAAIALEQEKDEDKFLRIAEEILTMHKDGAFEQALTKEANQESFEKIARKYYLLSVLVAVGENKWVRADKLFKEWRSQPAIWNRKTPGEGPSTAEDLEETCTEMAIMSEFFDALQSADLFQANVQLEKLRSLSVKKKQERLPDKGWLKFCETTLRGTVQRCFADGPLVALQFVLSMRSELEKLGLFFRS